MVSDTHCRSFSSAATAHNNKSESDYGRHSISGGLFLPHSGRKADSMPGLLW